MRSTLAALLFLLIGGSVPAEPLGATRVPVIVLDGFGGHDLTINKIVLFPGELVVTCFAKPTSTEAYCYILQPNGQLYAGPRRLLAVPA